MKLSPAQKAEIYTLSTMLGAALSWMSVGIVIGLLIAL